MNRPARTTGHACRELHCEAADRQHSYGDNGCSWVKLKDGEIMSRQEFEDTSTRPDKLRRS